MHSVGYRVENHIHLQLNQNYDNKIYVNFSHSLCLILSCGIYGLINSFVEQNKYFTYECLILHILKKLTFYMDI